MIYDRNAYKKKPLSLNRELKILFNVHEKLTVMEIGACEGEDSIKYSKLFDNSQVIVFEPLNSNVEKIKKSIIEEKIENIRIVDKAVSSICGRAKFHVSSGNPSNIQSSDWDFGNKSSSLLPPDKHTEVVDFIDFNSTIEVETINLYDFCFENSIKCIDFMHVDVQGAELMVLKGLGSQIKNLKSIWLEVSTVTLYKNQPLEEDIRLFLEQHNFILIKNCLEGITGDQLYINKLFYPNYKELQKKIVKSENINIINIFIKIKKITLRGCNKIKRWSR
jgi:FkbM family methyltransferase